jgi:hypothetical protein
LFWYVSTKNNLATLLATAADAAISTRDRDKSNRSLKGSTMIYQTKIYQTKIYWTKMNRKIN